MKRLLTLVLALAMVLSLAACGSKKPVQLTADGGAVVVLEKDCTPEKLYELIRSLFAVEDRCREMSLKLHTMVRLDSAERICDIVEQLTPWKK